MIRFFFILTLVLPTLTLGATPEELPKDLRVAQEMMQDGLGRDAASRIRAWLEKNSRTPQPEAELLLAEALLLDHRPEEVCVFHGDPKPEDIKDPFVVDNWR